MNLKNPFRYSYFQLTFGQEEAYLHPEVTYRRLSRLGYDAVEVCPPKGRYGLGVSMENYLEAHKELKAEYGLEVSNVNECWGEMWDPYSPDYKTLTEQKTADLAVSETRETIDFAAELGAGSVTIATAIHDAVTGDNVDEAAAVAVDSLRRMGEFAAARNIKLVFEATNHLEMGKFVNTAANHRRLIELTGMDNIGIQLDWFHVNLEETSPYEALMDAQPYLWHLHFRDSNSLTPGYGKTDWASVMRGLKRTGYTGYCTIECAPMVPDSDTAARDGIEYLKMVERFAEYQLQPDFPNGYALPSARSRWPEVKQTLKTFGPGTVPLAVPAVSGVSALLKHVPGDPDGVFRLYLSRGKNCSVEICPSKGLSVRDTVLCGRQVFWDPPLPNLPDPADIDLAGTMVVGGTPMEGMTWTAYFAAHVEMLGPINWGMATTGRDKLAGGLKGVPVTDDELLCLHGNASMIPVEELSLELNEGGAVVEGSFLVRDANGCWPPSDSPPLYRVTKRIELPPDRDALVLTDTIENLSDRPVFPDWGYHLQLRPEPGCRLTVPSATAAPRGGGSLSGDWQLWREASKPPKREERGYIHKGIRCDRKFEDGSPAFECLLEYPDGSGTRCLLPQAPYVMSWFSCGGAGDDEFLWPDGSRWLHRNWDGVGPEIGASALDHDGDVDPAVVVRILEPGESTVLILEIEPFGQR